MIDNKILNIDGEYVLHICSGAWKRYEIYKPKKWTDKTYYINAWSDDGEKWLLKDICGKEVGQINTTSISIVVEKLKALNKNRHYVQQLSMNCAGKDVKATDFNEIPYNTIEEIENVV